MKKQTLVSAAVAATLMPIFGLSGLASAASDNYITVIGPTGTSQCAIYDEDGASSLYTPCDASYGSYDSSTNVLTLGTGLNNAEAGSSVFINLTSSVNTIKADGNIKTDIVLKGKKYILNFGTYSFTGNLRSYATDTVIGNGNYNGITHEGGFDGCSFGDNLIIDGGNLSCDTAVSTSNSFTIKSGSISANGILGWNNVVIDGGKINITKAHLGISLGSGATGSIDINAGDVAIASEDEGFGITGRNRPININGGTIKLSAGKGSAFGISTSDSNITINGGNITIDGFEWGISGTANKIYFNGGTTEIKNSSKHSVWITQSTDPKNDIVFGKNMGIVEDTYVFYDKDNTGIAAPNGATIASGYTYRKHEGWEVNTDEPEDTSEKESKPAPASKSSTPKTPDTGVFSGENNAMLIAISVGLVTVLSGAVYLGLYTLNRRSKRVKFNKDSE